MNTITLSDGTTISNTNSFTFVQVLNTLGHTPHITKEGQWILIQDLSCEELADIIKKDIRDVTSWHTLPEYLSSSPYIKELQSRVKSD